MIIGVSLWMMGVIGVLISRRSVIRVLISIELMLIGVNMYLIMNSCAIDDVMGEVFGIFILTVAAAESAIGLGIIIVYYRIRGVISIESVMKG